MLFRIIFRISYIQKETIRSENIGERQNYGFLAQEFAAGQTESAREARAFLAKHGVETAMVIQPGGSVQLITTQGFNRSDPAQRKMAATALEEVHKIGKRFYAQGGGYKLNGYFKTLKGDAW